MMTFLRFFLGMVEVVSGVLLIAIILLQKSKDEGLGLAFGTAVGETLFGSRAGNVLTRLTIILAAVFMVNTLLFGAVVARSTPRSLVEALPDDQARPASQPVEPAALPVGSLVPEPSSMPASTAAPEPFEPPAPAPSGAEAETVQQ